VAGRLAAAQGCHRAARPAARGRAAPSEGPTFAICSYGDDFFLVIRPDGDDVRLMISDATAAVTGRSRARPSTSSTSRSPRTTRRPRPAGDLDIFADLGIDSMELVAVCSDLEAYPDEMLGQVAARIGFGPQFESVVDDDLT
jgi:putative tRNA adenosine deaminase-associated protein